jgi:S1-C subfamily serine protease
MECPRCHHSQDEEIECIGCGVLFEKYHHQQETLQKQSAAAPGAPCASAPRRWIAWLAIAGVGAVTAPLLTVLGRSDHIVLTNTSERQATSESVPLAGLAGRLTVALAPASAIERARLATVNIKTPWGLGSGFFINAECQIVTNRHIVDAERAILKLEKQIVAFEKGIRSKQESIQYSEAAIKRGGLADQDVATIELFVVERREAIVLMSDKLQEFYLQRENIRLSGESVVVKIVDGTEYPTRGFVKSRKHDLALLQIEEKDCPFLQPAPGDSVRVGTPVHALGSPLNLEATVPSGILLHFAFEVVRGTSTDLLLTSLTFDTSNSGGPVIDESGQVLGVITLRAKKVKFRGFAIPIDLALSDLGIEFNSLASRRLDARITRTPLEP